MGSGDDITGPSEAHIEAEAVRLLYQPAWLMSLVVGVTATALTAYMFLEHADARLIAAWLFFINSTIALRVGVIVLFTRLQPSLDQRAKWGRYYMLLVWTNGIAWGLPAFALDSRELTLVFFYTLVIGGFVAGAIPGLSFNIKAFYGFAGFASLPLIATLFSFEEDFFKLLGVLSLLFLLINTASARISNRRIKRQIRLEYENLRLVDHLKAEKERAERANEVKTRFLAAASHDLRQPLNAIGLFVDALDARVASPETRRIIDNLMLSTHSLKGLLNSMLDISKLDAGVVQPDAADCSLQLLLDQLALEFGPQAAGRGLELRIRPCDAWVRSDPIMLTRVLRNLLSNAIRYTDEGRVLLGCRRSTGAIRIEVHDTGPGIPAAETEQIFEEFYQRDNPERDRDKGLGLGLAIVKRLASLLQHPLSVRSRVGAGSVFAITVPTVHASVQPIAQMPQYRDDMAHACVLVIDDDASIRAGMAELLGSWGCQPILADSAESALGQFAESDRSPDLIIADYRLREGKTGVQGIARINRHFGREIPALIVTGDIAPERLREAKASGYQLLHKPVSAANLRSLASYLIQKQQGRAVS